MGSHRTKALIRLAALLATIANVFPSRAQEAGWSYSPLPGEGDRATLGCADGSDATSFVCFAVRCEDDFSTGIHIHTSRPEGDVGQWLVTIDKEERWITAEAGNGPYGARVVEEDFAWMMDRLQQGGIAHLHPRDDQPLPRNRISLAGSLYAINRALAWCAPRVPRSEPMAPQGVKPEQ